MKNTKNALSTKKNTLLKAIVMTMVLCVVCAIMVFAYTEKKALAANEPTTVKNTVSSEAAEGEEALAEAAQPKTVTNSVTSEAAEGEEALTEAAQPKTVTNSVTSEAAEGEEEGGIKKHLIAFGICFVLAFIVVMIMKGSSYNRVTTNNMTYHDPKSRGITDSKDIYVRTAVTKVKREKQENK